MRFETDERGHVKGGPLLGYATAPAMDSVVLLQLHHAPTEQSLADGGEKLVVHMSPQQALDLSKSLESQAKRLLALPVPDLKS